MVINETFQRTYESGSLGDVPQVLKTQINYISDS